MSEEPTLSGEIEIPPNLWTWIQLALKDLQIVYGEDRIFGQLAYFLEGDNDNLEETILFRVRNCEILIDGETLKLKKTDGDDVVKKKIVTFLSALLEKSVGMSQIGITIPPGSGDEVDRFADLMGSEAVDVVKGGESCVGRDEGQVTGVSSTSGEAAPGAFVEEYEFDDEGFYSFVVPSTCQFIVDARVNRELCERYPNSIFVEFRDGYLASFKSDDIAEAMLGDLVDVLETLTGVNTVFMEDRELFVVTFQPGVEMAALFIRIDDKIVELSQLDEYDDY
jgi:hypothetical protein